VDLASLTSIGAGEAGRESRQGRGAERLEGAGDGSRTGNPPEGPGKTARRGRNLVKTRKIEDIYCGVSYLLNMMVVLKSVM
jgi:hypothetical protein